VSTTTPSQPPSGLPPGTSIPPGFPLPRPGDTGMLGRMPLPGVADDVLPRRRTRIAALLVLPVVTGLLLALLMLPLVGGVGLTAKATADSFNDLPAALVVPPLPERSVILDRTGRPIAELHGTEDRVNVPLSRIPVSMRQAIVAIEDRRFYEHHGIDFKGVLRAAVTNQESGAVTQGGSTLTQQYVKNALITLADTDEGRQAAQERSVKRKLREARYAVSLEKTLSKDQILTNYLNIAYFGDGAYGVAAAAQHYFGKDISQIDPVQSALLAGLVQNPNAYNPKLHPKTALVRRNLVLAAMRDSGYISQPAYAYGSAMPIKVQSTPAASDGCEEAGTAAFFCQYLRQTLLDDPQFGPTPEERQRRLFEGGLRIRTTLDPAVQASTQKAIDETVPAGNRVATAAVVLQPGTGDVLAMAVNRIYGATTDKKPVETTADRVHTKLNYAVLPFQAGSTYKLFTLAAALDSGIPLSTTFNSPNCYRSQVFSNPVGNGNCFHNASDGEGGVFNMTQATANSVNTYFVQLEERVGVLKARDMAKRLGVTTPLLDQVDPGEGSFTLGTTITSPIQMATAYATIAAHGTRCMPKPVLDMTEQNQKSSYDGPGGQCQQVLDPRIADTISNVLETVITQGTAAKNGPIGRPAAGKTGTTEDNQSAWFIGFVPQMAAAVWVGDSRNPVQYPLHYGPSTPDGVPVPGWGGGPVFGGDLPTEVWSRAMRAATADLPVENFPPPDQSLARGRATAPPVADNEPNGPVPAPVVPAPSAPVVPSPTVSSAPPPSPVPQPTFAPPPPRPSPTATTPRPTPKPSTTRPTPKPPTKKPGH
jgi:membrane peptidoglycan carboxypeptidase